MPQRERAKPEIPFSIDQAWGWLANDYLQGESDPVCVAAAWDFITLTALMEGDVLPLVDQLRFGISPGALVLEELLAMLENARPFSLAMHDRRGKRGPRIKPGDDARPITPCDDALPTEDVSIMRDLRKGDLTPLIVALRACERPRPLGREVCKLLAHMLWPSPGTENVVPYELKVRNSARGRRRKSFDWLLRHLRGYHAQLKIDVGVPYRKAIEEIAEAGNESEELVRRDLRVFRKQVRKSGSGLL
jgi:hypothetical protein